MPQFLDWIVSNFFIVFIILGALISVFSKKNAKPNGGGEPFGGRGASPQRQGQPQQRRVQSPSGERQSPFAGAPANSGNGRNERRSDSQPSGTNTERTNLEEASRQMNAEIEKRLREQRSMQRGERSVANATRQIERAASGSPKNRPSKNNSNHKTEKQVSPALGTASALMSNPTANELRKGILWAEVLGSPRARKPYSSGRR